MKKQVVFIAQSKGGTGKSFLTWFIARNKKEDNTVFIDLDKSTRTSVRLRKIVGDKRVLELSIMDDNHKLDREMFLNLLEKISTAKTDDWYVDLGAPESDELKSFFTNEVPAQELKEICEEIGIDLKIYIVLAGGDAFSACIEYYKQINELAGEHLEVVAIKNEGTFGSIKAQEQGESLLVENGITTKNIGTMSVGNSQREIISLISGKIAESDLTLAGKRSLKKMTEEVKEVLL